MADRVEFAGKSALVTGGARRIGAAIVRDLAAAGLRVIIHYRDSAAEAKALAAAVGGCVVQGDLSREDGAEKVWEEAVQVAGPVDFLIHNASYFPAHRLAGFSLDDLEVNMRLHAWSPLVLGRALAAQARSGAVVNLLDSRVTDYDAEHVPYHVSKRVLHDLTRMMALEFAPGIRVNAVAPGLIVPPEGKDAAYLHSLADTNPLQSVGSTAGISDAVLFLLRSTFVTGQTIFVDGGRHMKGQVYG